MTGFLDAIVKRLTLGLLAGLLASLFFSGRVAVIVGVAVFYVLLVLAPTVRSSWPSP